VKWIHMVADKQKLLAVLNTTINSLNDNHQPMHLTFQQYISLECRFQC